MKKPFPCLPLRSQEVTFTVKGVENGPITSLCFALSSWPPLKYICQRICHICGWCTYQHERCYQIVTFKLSRMSENCVNGGNTHLCNPVGLSFWQPGRFRESLCHCVFTSLCGQADLSPCQHAWFERNGHLCPCDFTNLFYTSDGALGILLTNTDLSCLACPTTLWAGLWKQRPTEQLSGLKHLLSRSFPKYLLRKQLEA